jgi:hypothetical protein
MGNGRLVVKFQQDVFSETHFKQISSKKNSLFNSIHIGKEWFQWICGQMTTFSALQTSSFANITCFISYESIMFLPINSVLQVMPGMRIVQQCLHVILLT